MMLQMESRNGSFGLAPKYGDVGRMNLKPKRCAATYRWGHGTWLRK